MSTRGRSTTRRGGSRLTHVAETGAARMVDVGEKAETHRVATASGRVRTTPEVVKLIRQNSAKKGDVLAAARIAGILAAKRTSDLIPLCHPLRLDLVTVDFTLGRDSVGIAARAETTGKTGVEMEAVTAVAVAALTVYDMCKAVDRGIVIDGVQLEEKSGGKSGTWRRGRGARRPG